MSVETSLKSNTMKIELDTAELSTHQIRLIRSINAMLTHVSKCDDENEYFEGSAELMRMCAALISKANFNEETKKGATIPYAEQALEYSMDVLQEYMTTSKVVNYDN